MMTNNKKNQRKTDYLMLAYVVTLPVVLLIYHLLSNKLIINGELTITGHTLSTQYHKVTGVFLIPPEAMSKVVPGNKFHIHFVDEEKGTCGHSTFTTTHTAAREDGVYVTTGSIEVSPADMRCLGSAKKTKFTSSVATAIPFDFIEVITGR